MPTIEVEVHAVNVRSAPSAGASAPYALTQGQQATVDIYLLNTWLHTTAPHDGYIYSAPGYFQLLDVVIPPPSAPNGSDATTNVKVNTDLLNVRDKPSLSGNIMAQLAKGAIVQVYSQHNVKADGHNWYQLYGTLPRWIAGDLTVSVDTAPIPAPAPPITPPPAPNAPQLPWSLPFSANARGVGLNAGGWSPSAAELALIKANDVQTVLTIGYNTGVAQSAIPALRGVGVQNVIVRASTTEPISTVQRFLDLTIPVLKEYAAQLGNGMIIAIHNEPNLVSEGLRKGWNEGAGFAVWWSQVAQVYRATFPGCKLGYPALSPGSTVTSIREDAHTFAQQSIAALRSCDWIGLHAYWANQDGSDFAPDVAYWRQFGKPIIGTEIGPVNNAVVTPQTVQRAYTMLASLGVPCMAWILNGSGMFQGADWTANNLRL